MLEACNFIKKETLAQDFYCEFCEISKNTFFHRTPLVADSIYVKELKRLYEKKEWLSSNSYISR